VKLPLIPIVLVAALTVWALSGWRLGLAVLLGGVVEALDTAWTERQRRRAGERARAMNLRESHGAHRSPARDFGRSG
jgi:hypothetical protein